MLSEEIIAVLGLLSIAWWPIALAIMFFLRKRFPPSNDRYAAFRALAYVVIFWLGRTGGTLGSQAPTSYGGIGVGTQELSMLLFSLPIAILWIYVAYRLIERASWKDLGWNLSNIKREISFGVLLGAALFLLVNLETAFTKKPTINVDAEIAVILFVVSFGVASWQEENIYRGYLQPKLRAVMVKWRANVFQAILFSITHIGYWQFTSALPFLMGLAVVALMGFILGYYRQHYGSLIAPFIAHGMVDFLPIFWRY